VKGKINLKAKPYGIGQEKSDNPLDRVIIKTFKKKDNGDDTAAKDTDDTDQTMKQDEQAIKIRKKILRMTPEQKSEDPMDKVVIKTFVKKKPADTANSEDGIKRLSNDESQPTHIDGESCGLKTTIDSINKHLNESESANGSPESRTVVKDVGTMEASPAFGKRPAEALTTAQPQVCFIFMNFKKHLNKV
jgi:hypothetical protein